MAEVLVVERDAYGRPYVLARMRVTGKCEVCGARMGDDPKNNPAQVRCTVHRMQMSIAWEDDQVARRPAFGRVR